VIHPEVYKYIPNLHPFIDYAFEDKSSYPLASSAGYVDQDNDFLIGNSGGFLMKMDFIFVNTHIFTEVARNFQQSAKTDNDRVYSFDMPGTVAYNSFWRRETQRRRGGMIAPCKLYRKDIEAYNRCTTDEERLNYLHPLHITGDHYNYLNYGRINRTPTKEERIELDKAGKFKAKFISGFPRFWDGDYWNFKTDEFIARNGLHLCKGKARRKGYSHKRGSQGANTINLTPDVTIVLVAWDIAYLTEPGATSDMLKTCLDWYENKTFWKRGYLSESLEEIELGYKKTNTGNKKFGFRSKAISVTCRDNPDAAIGKAAVEIDFEESGKNPILQQALNVTLSATEVGDEQVGTIRVYGTGGTKGANWIDFSRMYFNPKINGMMAFENVWSKGLRHTVCGFFHPQIWNYEPHMDVSGNSMLVESYLIDEADKTEKRKDLQVEDYAIYCSQRANSPDEAFNLATENIFSSTELNELIKFRRATESTAIYREGQFSINITEEDKKDLTKFNIPVESKVTTTNVEFITNDIIRDRGERIHPYIVDVPFTKNTDVYGAWRIFHEPKRFNGIIPDNLYYVIADTVGKDKTIKEVTTKNSLNAIYVMSYPNDMGIAEGIQAIYVGRRDDSQTDCSLELLKAVEYYNAKGLPETDRGTVVNDFKRWNKTNRLIKNPLAVIANKVKDSAINEYGIYIGEGDNAVDGIINLKKWLYQIINTNEDGSPVYRIHYIPDLPTLLELQQYTINGNFDRISALRLLTFERLAYVTKKKRPSGVGQQSTFLSEFGLYKVN
jgi:hypothetical protein